MRLSMFVSIALLAVSGCVSVERAPPPQTTTVITQPPATMPTDTSTTTTIHRTSPY
jgi:hypothetical protein